MRLATSIRMGGRVRLPPAFKEILLPLSVLVVGVQPFGSPAALVLFFALALAVLLLNRVPARPLGNFLVPAALLCGLALLCLPLRDQNPMLTGFYLFYLLTLLAVGVVIQERIGSLPDARMEALAAWILIADLALNLPSVALQLLLFGPGDMVQGFSGLLIGDALSQNRTNSIRAGFMIILCLAILRRRPGPLARISLCFNASTLLLATSMTAIFSAILAFSAFYLLALGMSRFLPYAVVAGSLAFLSDRINQAVFKSTSVFQFLFSMNTRWIPKLDAYNHYFSELAWRNPVIPWIGEGIGNYANRFSVLANFRNYSQFPGKDMASRVFESQTVIDHLINRYNLEGGIVGNSIVSIPWSGVLGFLTESGAVGAALFLLAGWGWLRHAWSGPSGGGSPYSRLMLLFLFFNLMFDNYLDYPEVILPFLVIMACVTRISERPEPGEPPSVPGPAQRPGGTDAVPGLRLT